MRFATRLALFLVCSLIGVQALTVGVSYFLSREIEIQRGRGQLARAAALFEQRLEATAQRAGDAVEVLALDFALRRAIAQRDVFTVQSALLNHGRRIAAKRMILVGLDGNVIADTAQPDAAPGKFPFPALLDKAGADGLANGKAVVSGALDWLFAAPVRAPMPIAFIVAVVPIDNKAVGDALGQTGLPISIQLLGENGKRLAAANTLTGEGVSTLDSRLSLTTLEGSPPAYAKFELSLADALKPYYLMIIPLLIVSVAGLAAAIWGAVYIARIVAKPLEQLAANAKMIAGGTYANLRPVKGPAEINHLSSALTAMAQSIDDRQRELEASRDAAVRATAAKSEFLANMSHEIRTPLNAVLGLAGVLLDTQLTGEQRKQVALIKDSGDNLLGLLNDILDLSKLDAGQVELETLAFDPVALTNSSIDLLRQRAQQKGIALELDLGEVPSAVVGDPARIRQVLINLVGNAIKFTNEGRVFVRLAALERRENGVALQWSVSDTGIGVPAGRIGSLFQEFTQGDSSISRRFGGSGLGLAICKRLVERMSGKIEASSVQGEGSTFSFSVPLAIAEAAANPTAAVAETSDLAGFAAAFGRTIRILVVEDNVTNQVVARSILKVDGVHVDVAGDGREAIEAVRRYPYDLVFMDVQMPEMDGLTATREIRAAGGTLATMPIIAFSANAFASDIDTCLKAGMNGHVAKPVQKETLRAAVVGALSGRFSVEAKHPDQRRASDAPDFDRACVDALIESMTVAVVRDLLTEFVASTRQKIERLPALLNENKKLTVEVHALKSAGAQVGAMRLSRLAAALEKRALAEERVRSDDFAPLTQALDGYEQGLKDHVRAAG